MQKIGSQDIPGVAGKFNLGAQNEVGQRLTEFNQENTMVMANSLLQENKKWLYTWASPDGQYQNQIDYISCSWRWRGSIESAKKQDLELTMAQVINSFLQNSGLNWRK